MNGAASCERRADSKKGTKISERATNVGYHLPLAACPGGAGLS